MRIGEVLPPFRQLELPPEVLSVPTMLIREELKLLFTLARHYFRNEGHIIDAGCFLGGSTAALGRGLVGNERFKAAPRRGVITAYDLFTLWGDAAGQFFPEGTPQGTDFLPRFRQNVAFLGDLLDVRVGDITKSGPPPCPVEILFIDVAKSVSLNDWVVRQFFPTLIPNHSVVVQQDYLWTGWNGWIHVTMEHFADHFEIVEHTEQNSVAFLYTKEIPPDRIPDNLVGGMARSQVIQLQDQAIARFGGKQKDLLLQSRENLHSMLNLWSDSVLPVS